MISPVDFISGPRFTSTVSSLAKLKTGAFTDTCGTSLPGPPANNPVE